MIHSLFYVSRSLLELPGGRDQLNDIIAVSRSRNAVLDVTGALVFTELRFAQQLEGPKAAIDQLMASIHADQRHTSVEILLSEPVAERQFAGWSMAYAGGSFFMSQLVEPLAGRAAGAPLRPQIGRVVRMMQEFAG